MADESTKGKADKGKDDVLMLFIIMAALTGVYLGGLGVILGIVGADEFDSADIVAISAPALAAIGAVAGGVFGYSLGTRGTTEAQRTASEARERVGIIRAGAERLERDTKHIASQGLEGDASEGKSDHRDISEEDLRTLRADAEALADSLSRTP